MSFKVSDEEKADILANHWQHKITGVIYEIKLVPVQGQKTNAKVLKYETDSCFMIGNMTAEQLKKVGRDSNTSRTVFAHIQGLIDIKHLVKYEH